jgi:pimeloyl-ACP methyl ester carboxylesterase
MDLTEFDAHRAITATRSGEISYAEFGAGRPVLFVHGLGTNGMLWRNVIAELRGEARLIAIDLPGHGLSPVGSGHEHTLSSLADSVAEFLDVQGLTRVDLVANDTGGAVAQIFAARYPERLTTLTLTNCEAHDNLPNEAFRPTVELARSGRLGAMAARMLADPAVARSPQSLGGNYEDPAYLTEEMIRAYLEPVAGTPAAARDFERLLSSLEPANLLDIEPALRRLTVPTLIVWGTADSHFDISWAYWLRDAIPGAREVVELPGAKLHFPDERAAELVPVLRRHWAGHPPGDAAARSVAGAAPAVAPSSRPVP